MRCVWNENERANRKFLESFTFHFIRDILNIPHSPSRRAALLCSLLGELRKSQSVSRQSRRAGENFPNINSTMTVRVSRRKSLSMGYGSRRRGGMESGKRSKNMKKIFVRKKEKAFSQSDLRSLFKFVIR
jgi:hypothetical protein